MEFLQNASDELIGRVERGELLLVDALKGNGVHTRKETAPTRSNTRVIAVLEAARLTKENGYSTERAAREKGVKYNAVELARELLDDATDELIERVERGAISIDEAIVLHRKTQERAHYDDDNFPF